MGERHRRGSAEGAEDGQRANGGGTESAEVAVAPLSVQTWSCSAA